MRRSFHDLLFSCVPQYQSWKRAVSTGNWGVTPEEQRDWTKNRTKEQHAQNVSFEAFAWEHHKWFAKIRRVCAESALPMLDLASEDLIGDPDAVRVRLASFLRGPAL